MPGFGVHSEIGKLRQVIVHRPELSLKWLTPGNHDELLFDDVLWVERAQWEHDQFVARMRERGVEVFYVQDLLAEALAADDVGRLRLISLVASEAVVGPSVSEEVKACLAAFPPDVLARHLIGGLTVAESGLDLGRLAKASLIASAIDDESIFVLPPLPNTLFTRDSSCWIYGGVILHSGGLTLTAGEVRVALTSFIIENLDGDLPLTGVVKANDSIVGRLPLFNLALTQAPVLTPAPGGFVTLVEIGAVQVTLTPEAAEALNAAFGLSGVFTEGFPIGTARVSGRVRDRDG